MNPLIRLQKICLGCVAVLACHGLSPALNANTIAVTNTRNSGPGSLRAALKVANDGDTIDATGVSGTILLTRGALQITHTVHINGPGAGNLAVNGNATSAVFENSADGVTISGFTITNGSGGGILNHPAAASSKVGLTLTGCSVVNNPGGGISNIGVGLPAVLTLSNCTISGHNYNAGGFAELELGSTILKVGSSGQNILNNGGTVTSLGYNLASGNGGGFLTGPGDQINTDPMLGPLQDNGGRTFTQALLPGSPAINRGDPNFTPPPSFDQRGPGYHRVVNGRIDIGSFEVQATPTPTPTAP